MRSILNKIQNLIKRGVVSLTNNDSAAISYAQIKFLNKAANVEYLFPYGINANPPTGTMVGHFAFGANEGNLGGVPYTRQERFKNLKAGEVVVGSPKSGSYIKFLENGDIEINSKGKVIVNAVSDITATTTGNINANCNTYNLVGQTFNLTSQAMTFTSGSFSFGFGTSGVFSGNGKFNFGSSGAAIARVGDSVLVDGKTGTITSGSSNNTSN